MTSQSACCFAPGDRESVLVFLTESNEIVGGLVTPGPPNSEELGRGIEHCDQYCQDLVLTVDMHEREDVGSQYVYHIGHRLTHNHRSLPISMATEAVRRTLELFVEILETTYVSW